jgi:allantoicase
MMALPLDLPTLKKSTINLASASLGAAVLSANDEFFGAKERLISDATPVFIPEKYDDNGKWMDGWETRRRRDAGHDHLVLRLATAGSLRAICIDTAHFTGNYPHAASIEGALCDGDPDDDTIWSPILKPTALRGDHLHIFEVKAEGAYSHLRLNIFPDGGVARLHAYGRPLRPPKPDADGLIDLASALSGTRVIACNDAHYGDPSNMLLPGIAPRMEEGWETRRRREPGNDWAILALGYAGTIKRVVIDTTEFKGNYPESASIQAIFAPGLDDAAAIPSSIFWKELLRSQKLGPHREHRFEAELALHEPVTHVRLNIFPDGGVNRLRLFGQLHAES